MKHLSDDLVDVAFLETTDIGGTNAQFGSVDMRKCERVYARVEIGTWDAADDLDECRLEQGDGSTWKDLTTDGAGADYDTANPVDADGDFVVLEASAEDLDRENGFYLVRGYVAEGGNTGPDNITGVIFGHNSKTKNAFREAAPVTGSKVYVRPS
jgi:hypothetical protein